MRPVTREMIKIYNLKKLGYDFMGYTFKNMEELSFHHLIVPRNLSKKQHLESNGFIIENGAILNQETAHDYLHVVERVDRDIFLAITQQMIEENRNGRIDIENLKKIRDYLLYFESHYADECNSKGKVLIKEKYISNRIKI